jgi:hypothetical protein
MSGSKIALCVVGFIAAILALSWIIQGNEFFMYKVFAPAREDVGREVFENTKSYRRGLAQNLYREREAWLTADAEHKTAIASVILSEVGDDYERLPPDLQSFIDQLRRGR